MSVLTEQSMLLLSGCIYKYDIHDLYGIMVKDVSLSRNWLYRKVIEILEADELTPELDSEIIKCLESKLRTIKCGGCCK